MSCKFKLPYHIILGIILIIKVKFNFSSTFLKRKGFPKLSNFYECHKCIFYIKSTKSNVDFGCRIRVMNSYSENLCQFLSRIGFKIDYDDGEYFYMEDVSLYNIIKYEK